jgi:predicted PurR-regulated permease PerM
VKRTLKRLVGRVRGGRRSGGESDATPEPDVTADPTPIPISKRTRTALILALLVLLGLVVWYVPSVLSTLIGGFTLALALSFPVGWLSRIVPRGLAILLTFLILAGLVVLAVLYLVPLAGRQIGSLVGSLPAIANTAERYLQDALGFLQERGLLRGNSDQVAQTVRDRLTEAARTVGRSAIGGP